MNYKRLFLVMALQVVALPAMYKVGCKPFSSIQKGFMKETVYGLIDKSHKALLVAMFMFTDKEAARKLALARARGVQVEVIMDNVSVRGNCSINEFLKKFHVPVFVYKSSDGIHHNKYMVVDNNKVWISSMNWTNAAFHKNSESGVLICSKPIAMFYRKDFKHTTSIIKRQQEKDLESKKKFLKALVVERKKHQASLLAWKKAQRR